MDGEDDAAWNVRGVHRQGCGPWPDVQWWGGSRSPRILKGDLVSQVTLRTSPSPSLKVPFSASISSGSLNIFDSLPQF